MLKNFFREDLNLNQKWWHRLFKVLFFISIFFFFILGLNEYQLKGFIRVGSLYELVSDKPETVEQLIKKTGIEDVIISSDYEPTSGKDSTWGVPRDAICSTNLTSAVERLALEGREFYIGEMFNRIKVGEATFLDYVKKKGVVCIVDTSYTNEIGQSVLMVQTHEVGDYQLKDTYLYKPNFLKTVWYFVFGTYFSKSTYVYSGIWTITLLPSIFLILLYYKVFIYIVYGSKKNK